MIANAITYCRIIISMRMFLFSVFSSGFYVCYLIAGISDMIDGTIARKLGTSSKFGEKLDTVADFVFAVIALFNLLPVMKISIAIWIWIGLIAVIKLINIISGFVVQKHHKESKRRNRLICLDWTNKAKKCREKVISMR